MTAAIVTSPTDKVTENVHVRESPENINSIQR